MTQTIEEFLDEIVRSSRPRTNPRPPDQVWIEERKSRKAPFNNPRGEILFRMEQEEALLIKFEDGETEEYLIDLFTGKWNDKLQCWQVNED